MPRPPRFVIPGLPQHVIVRANNRDPIFVVEEDYPAYLDWLRSAAVKHGCAIHAYVLMTNHVHVLVTPSTEHGLGKMVQMVGRYYVQYFNHQYRRTGTLWEGRYKASLIDSEQYLLTCQRYIEMNPVRANMVGQPAEYPWSSYLVNAGSMLSNLVTQHELYLQLGLPRLSVNWRIVLCLIAVYWIRPWKRSGMLLTRGGHWEAQCSCKGSRRCWRGR